MKIRNRIAYTFTALFGGLIFILCLIVYIISSSTKDQLFYNRLDERLKITEEFFLESDSFTEEVRQKVRANFLKTLPQEIEYADTLAGFNAPAELQPLLPANFLQDLSTEKPLLWKKEERQGIAKIYNFAQQSFVVIVVATDEYGNAYLKRLRFILLISCLVSLIVIYFLSNFFSKKVLKPIAGKINKANKISASNLDLRLTVYNENDELGMLASSFNSLLDRLQEAFELEKNFVRYASHEMKNPLAVILGEAEVTLLKARTSNEYIATIEKIKAQAEKLNKLVEHFLQLSKLDSAKLKKDTVLLDELMMEVSFELAQQYDTIRVTFNIAENTASNDFEINGDYQLLYNAVSNVVENACKFSADGQEVVIELSKQQQQTVIQVKDKGLGIEAEHINQIFEPLYRGANVQEIEGTGIGLALVKRIVELHNGYINVASTVGRGTIFTISI